MNDSLEVEEVGGDINMHEEPIQEINVEPEKNSRKPRGTSSDTVQSPGIP